MRGTRRTGRRVAVPGGSGAQVCPRCGAGLAIPGPVAVDVPSRCRCTREQLQTFRERQGELGLSGVTGRPPRMGETGAFTFGQRVRS
jgi:hypothetical protein